jgi:hypothetical protein
MLFEWELWMHPYPTVVKSKRYRIKRSLFRSNRVYQDGKEFVRISDLFQEARRSTPPQLKRCVLAIAKKAQSDGLDARAATSKGFAICTRQLQKHGYVKPGTNRPTKKGEEAGRSKAAQKKHKSRVAEYEKLLKKARGK